MKPHIWCASAPQVVKLRQYIHKCWFRGRIWSKNHKLFWLHSYRTGHNLDILVGTTDLLDKNLDKLWEMMRDREAWHGTVHAVVKSWMWLGDWTTASTWSGKLSQGKDCTFQALLQPGVARSLHSGLRDISESDMWHFQVIHLRRKECPLPFYLLAGWIEDAMQSPGIGGWEQLSIRGRKIHFYLI